MKKNLLSTRDVARILDASSGEENVAQFAAEPDFFKRHPKHIRTNMAVFLVKEYVRTLNQRTEDYGLTSRIAQLDYLVGAVQSDIDTLCDVKKAFEHKHYQELKELHEGPDPVMDDDDEEDD